MIFMGVTQKQFRVLLLATAICAAGIRAGHAENTPVPVNDPALRATHSAVTRNPDALALADSSKATKKAAAGDSAKAFKFENARQNAAYSKFDLNWKPAEPGQNKFKRAFSGFFSYDDRSLVASPVGFSGSQFWQHTFDPRTSVFTTPRVRQ
jgi:hypothetical protein